MGPISARRGRAAAVAVLVAEAEREIVRPLSASGDDLRFGRRVRPRIVRAL